MTQRDSCINSRRGFIKQSALAASATLGALAIPRGVHADASDTLKVGLIGCGGRGTGAALDALYADPQANITAIGDVFADRAAGCLNDIRADNNVGHRVLVERDHVFSGFEAYKAVIDSGVDVVLLTTPPHFRPQQFAYAVEKNKHCFVEKPVGVDVPGVRSVMESCKIAERKGLSVVSGLGWRYDFGVQATVEKIREGVIGDIVAIESQYNAGTLWHRGDKPEWSRMEYQLRNWYYYTWLSGDHIVEQAVHSLDKAAWLLGDSSPVRAVGIGGRQQRTDEKYGHIFDHHVVFYEYASGVKVFFTCRQQDNCASHVDELVLGTKGTAQILKNRIDGESKWRYRGPKPSVYRQEHAELFKSIRSGNPINNGHYMTNSTLIAIMGRMCSYTGQELTWDQFLSSSERLGPTAYTWGDVPEPTVAIPGITKVI